MPRCIWPPVRIFRVEFIISRFNDLAVILLCATFSFDIALLDSAVKRTNVVYGEKNIFVERVAFVYGKIDPWHALGVLDDFGHAYNAYLIPGG